MKNAASFSIAMLALLLAQTVGWQLASLAQLSEIKTRGTAATLAHASRPEERQVFHFSKKEFAEKRCDRREFWHGGKLFDISKIENLKGDSVHVTARHDAREQIFLEKMGGIARADSGSLPTERSHFPAQLARFLSEHFLPAGDFFLQKMPCFWLSAAGFSFLFFIKNWRAEPLGLPPEVV